MISSGLWWAFVVLSPIGYWLMPQKIRTGALALVSFAVLMYYAPADIATLAALATFVYLSHQYSTETEGLLGQFARIGRSPIPLFTVIAYFLYSKYLPSVMLVWGREASFLDFAIPIGISYFTFKLLHYSIERGRGNIDHHSFVDFGAYMFLPQIFVAGPIERFDHFIANRGQKFEWLFAQEGIQRIFQGLVKKFVIAASVSIILDRLFDGGSVGIAENVEDYAFYMIWIALFLEVAYVYFDFAGYSDIAIGASRLLGFNIMENFNVPYRATSLRDFWARWHMTLASWVLTYVYLPLVAQTRNPYSSIIAAFAVVGAWHAAWPIHWVIWGLWHGVGLAVIIWWTQQFRKRRSKFLQRPVSVFFGRVITLCYVALGGVFVSFYEDGSLMAPLRVIAGALGLA